MKRTLENRIMQKWRATVAVLALALATPLAAFAQNMIQSITTSQQAGTDVVRVELSEPLAAVPGGFSVQAPPRVAIDLPGVGNGLGKNSVELNQGNLRSANVAQSGERTRLVLNLRQAASYRVELQGKSMIVLLDSAGPVAASTGAPTQFAPAQNDQPLPLRDVDFRRGGDGAGRIVVDLSSTQVGVDIRQQGQNLVVEFLRSSLPDKLRRRLDVADFGTPVQAVSTFQSGDRVRMVVEPKGSWEHSAYQTDNQFVLEVRPMKVDPNKLVQGPGFSGEKLSLNFQNIEVRALLQVIADFTNFNVVTSDTVTGTVTLRLKDVPWDQALDIILQSKGLGVRKSGNVLWIAPKEELANREQVELESRKKIAELEPVRTQAFQLNYTKAETIAKSLVGSALVAQAIDNATGQNSGRILSPRGSVIFEQRTNQLFVTDIPSKLEEVQAMIAKIDIPVRQVLIEARIVEAADNWGQSLGVKLGFANLSGAPTSGPGAQVGGNYAAVGAQTGQRPPADFTNTQFVNLPANTGSLGAAAATFALSLFSASADKFLNLELSALENDGNGKIVSSPRVITADQVKALIEQGEELPYQAATSSGATSVQFRKAILKLEVTPQITPEGFVLLDLDVNKDSVGRPTLQGFAIDTKHVRTQVLVENGGTVVIGGIFTQTNQEEINKVPLLGDIPYMGWLFKNRLLTTKKTELLVFITPKIVTDRSAMR
ncbi:MAG: type IV pilus secretin PilQ [Burkholderiaceae bacterium]|nr:type IV pilus secretin PilQ [Burkholderiaceae bacterium]